MNQFNDQEKFFLKKQQLLEKSKHPIALVCGDNAAHNKEFVRFLLNQRQVKSANVKRYFAKELTLDELRQIVSMIYRTSFYKSSLNYFIIDEIETLSLISANFLLKTLESLPKNWRCFFIQSTASLASLPLTFLSRLLTLKIQIPLNKLQLVASLDKDHQFSDEQLVFVNELFKDNQLLLVNLLKEATLLALFDNLKNCLCVMPSSMGKTLPLVKDKRFIEILFMYLISHLKKRLLKQKITSTFETIESIENFLIRIDIRKLYLAVDELAVLQKHRLQLYNNHLDIYWHYWLLGWCSGGRFVN